MKKFLVLLVIFIQEPIKAVTWPEIYSAAKSIIRSNPEIPPSTAMKIALSYHPSLYTIYSGAPFTQKPDLSPTSSALIRTVQPVQRYSGMTPYFEARKMPTQTPYIDPGRYDFSDTFEEAAISQPEMATIPGNKYFLDEAIQEYYEEPIKKQGYYGQEYKILSTPSDGYRIVLTYKNPENMHVKKIHTITIPLRDQFFEESSGTTKEKVKENMKVLFRKNETIRTSRT